MLEDNNNIDCGPTKAAIVQEIDRLNAWQEQQLQVLQDRQNEQRRQLHLEQRNMYELMGFCRVDNVNDDVDEDDAHKDIKDMTNDEIKVNQQKMNIIEEPEIYTIGDCEPKQITDRGDGKQSMRKKNKIYEIANVFERLSFDKGDGLEAQADNKPKRQFLRRGEGLRQRFKVDPDEFKLDKLPRYKYANAHPHLRSAKSLRSLKLRTKPNKRNAAQKPVGQLITEKTEEEEEDEYVEGESDVAIKATEPLKPPKLEAQERRFQQLLITSKNVFNSTPDTKAPPLPSPKGVNKKPPKAQPAKKSICFGQAQELEQPKMAWAKVMDSQNIKAVVVEELRRKATDAARTVDDADNLSIFEMLEERAQDGSINLDESCIVRFLGKNLKTVRNAAEDCNEMDAIPVQSELRSAGLKPKVSNGSIIICSDEVAHEYASHFTDGACDETSNASEQNVNDTDDDENDDGDGEGEGDAGNDGEGGADNGDTDEHDDDNNEEDDYSGFRSSSASYESIEPNNGLFQQFKEVLFSVLNQRASKAAECPHAADTMESNMVNTINDESEIIASETLANANTTLAASDTAETIIEPPAQPQTVASKQPKHAVPLASAATQEQQLLIVKERNAELEREVASFKDANTQLTKLKQEFELEKAMFVQERQESLDELSDIKVKFEMYMHDERVKFEEEKRKYELHLRTQRLTNQNKDRREIAHLREEVEKLQQQMRQKEQTHAAAQARLRTQISKFEKDQKHLLEEIEQLKKDNKKLESECARLERENNNKMLETINKNIAKLAPKLPPPDGALGNSTAKHSTTLDESAIKPNLRKQRQSLLPTNFKSASHYGKLKKKTKKIITPQPPNSPCNNSESTDDVEDEDDDDTVTVIDESISMDLKANTPKYNLKKTPTTVLNVNDNQSKLMTQYKHDNNNNNNNNNNNGNSDVKKSPTGSPNECATPTNGTNGTANVKASKSTSEFQREIINADGSKDVWYSNGNLQKISANGMHIRMLYYNKDIKETDIENGTVKYYYAATNTWHTTYLDGLEILEFPNGQTEHRHKNGVIEIHFPNNSIKILNPADVHKEAEWRFEDGTQLVQMHNGDKILTLPNGQKEIHTKLNKRREYPDGTVKIVYPDGSQETRYSNGRVRLKDKDGKLIMDSDTAHANGGGRH